MGKLSGIFMVLLMINLIGYVVLSDYVTAYPATAGTASSSLTNNNPLLSLYGTHTDNSTGRTYYDVTNGSTLYGNVPTEPPASFISGVVGFVDKIFIMFSWVRAIIGIALFPVTMLSMLGLPWQLAMLLGVPLASLYILGIIDLLGGTDT